MNGNLANTFFRTSKLRAGIKILSTVSFALVISLTGIYGRNTVRAADTFKYEVTLDLRYRGGDDHMDVRRTTVISVQDPMFEIPPQTYTVYINNFVPIANHDKFIREQRRILDTLQITDENGTPLSYDIANSNTALIEANVSIPSHITSAHPYTLIAQYQSTSLVTNIGAITNLYIPGLAEDTKFTSQSYTANGRLYSNSYSYQTRLHIISDPRDISLITPKSIKLQKNKEERVLKFDQDDRLNQTGWIQLGTKQYYKFMIQQPVPSSQQDTITFPHQSTSITIPLPRDSVETNQKVYFEDFSVPPSKVRQDKDGNLYASFSIEDPTIREITVTGYITENLDLSQNKQLDDYLDTPLTKYQEFLVRQTSLDRYLQPDTYWEVRDAHIRAIADRLSADTKTLGDLIDKDYGYVTDTLEYDTEKVTDGNVRFGARKALEQGSGVCMEYADLMIALLRAQSVPARAVIGYGNDPSNVENSLLENVLQKQTISHQWVQIWVPSYGWMSLDPTWGDHSNRRYVGADLDHITWFVESGSDNFFGTQYESSTASRDSVDVYTVNLVALAESDIPDLGSLKYGTGEDLLNRFTPTAIDEISYKLRSNPFGNVFIQVLPACGILIVFLSATVTIQRLYIKAVRRRPSVP